MDLSLRPLMATDRHEWRRLWDQYIETRGADICENTCNTSFDRIILGNGGKTNEFRCIVANINQNLVGLIHYLFHRHCWKTSNVCYIQDVYVDLSYRRLGVGRALFNAAHEDAKSAGCSSAYWFVHENNSASRELSNDLAESTQLRRFTKVFL